MSKKSEEYLESKRCDFDLITIDHAKTYGKIVELECEIERYIRMAKMKAFRPTGKKRISELESEIERLMKL